MTTAKSDNSRSRTAADAALRGLDREPGRNHTAIVPFVDDVDRVVPPVRTGDAEEQTRPPKQPEPALLCQRPREDQLVATLLEVAAALLPNAVEVDLESQPDVRRQDDARPALRRQRGLRRVDRSVQTGTRINRAP